MKLNVQTTDGTKKIEVKENSAILNLSNMKITKIDLSKLNTPNIEDLNLSFNNIKEIDLEPLADFNKLKRFSIHTNNLKSIDLEPMSECINLQFFDCANNNIKEIDLNPLVNCINLKKLDISNNQIEKLDLKTMYFAPNLFELNLAKNKLKEIDLNHIALCTKLKTVDLSDNEFNKLDLTALFASKYLNRLILGEKEKEVAEWQGSMKMLDYAPPGIRFYFRDIKKEKILKNRKTILMQVIQKYKRIRIEKMSKFLGFDQEEELVSWLLQGKLPEEIKIKPPFVIVDRTKGEDISQAIDMLIRQFDEF